MDAPAVNQQPPVTGKAVKVDPLSMLRSQPARSVHTENKPLHSSSAMSQDFLPQAPRTYRRVQQDEVVPPVVAFPQIPANRSSFTPEPRPPNASGFKVMVANLASSVTEMDIQLLFEGAMQWRLLRPGTAEVVYRMRSHALAAVDFFNNGNLDGQLMNVALVSAVAVPTVPKPTPPGNTMGSGGGGGRGNVQQPDPGIEQLKKERTNLQNQINLQTKKIQELMLKTENQRQANRGEQAALAASKRRVKEQELEIQCIKRDREALYQDVLNYRAQNGSQGAPWSSGPPTLTSLPSSSGAPSSQTSRQIDGLNARNAHQRKGDSDVQVAYESCKKQVEEQKKEIESIKREREALNKELLEYRAQKKNQETSSLPSSTTSTPPGAKDSSQTSLQVNQELRLELENIRSTLKTKENLVQSLLDSNKQLSDEIHSLSEECQGLRGGRERDSDKMFEENKSLKEQVSSITVEIWDLKNEYQRETSRLNRIIGQKNQAEKELRKKLDQKMKEVAENRMNQDTRKREKDLLEENKTLKEQVSSITAEISDLKNGNQRETSRLNRVIGQKNQAEKELRKQLDQKTKEQTEYLDTITNLRDEKSKLEGMKTQRDGDLATLQRAISRHQTRESALETHLTSARRLSGFLLQRLRTVGGERAVRGAAATLQGVKPGTVSIEQALHFFSTQEFEEPPELDGLCADPEDLGDVPLAKRVRLNPPPQP